MHKPHIFQFTMSVGPKGTGVATQIFHRGEMAKEEAKAFVDPIEGWNHLIAEATRERDSYVEFRRTKTERN